MQAPALPLIVGIGGASGAVYGVHLLPALRNAKIPSHLIASKSAALTLKEECDLTVNQVRETPLHAGHLPSMLATTENGAIIVPPVPACYHRPKTIDDIVNQTVGRCRDPFDIASGLVKRWQPDAEHKNEQ